MELLRAEGRVSRQTGLRQAGPERGTALVQSGKVWLTDM